MTNPVSYALYADGVDAPTSIALPTNATIYVLKETSINLTIPNTDTLVSYIEEKGGFAPSLYHWSWNISLTETDNGGTGISLTGNSVDGWTISVADGESTAGGWKGTLNMRGKLAPSEHSFITLKTYYFIQNITIIVVDPSLPETGTLHTATPVGLPDEAIFMSDPSNKQDFLLFASNMDYNCVSSYTLFTGSEQPFEYVEIELSKKQLSVVAPDLMNRIIAGKNIVTLIGPGQGQYIVTSCKKSDTTWTIIAYSVSEQIRSLTTTSEITLDAYGTPYDILVDQALDGFSRLAMDNMPAPVQSVAALFYKDRNSWKPETLPTSDPGDPKPLTFARGTSVWYLISVCALKLGCKIWVSDGTLYVIDPSIIRSNPDDVNSNIAVTPAELTTTEIDTIYLNRNGPYPLRLTEGQEALLSNIVNLPKIGKEGQEVLRNKVIIEFNEKNDARIADDRGIVSAGQVGEGTKKGTAESGNDKDLVNGSLAYFDTKSFTTSIPEFGYENAKVVADQIAEMYCDAETSISFSVRELFEETKEVGSEGETVTVRTWKPTFGQLTHIHNIYDYSNDLVVSTKVNFNRSVKMPSKGMLSYIEYKFPEHVTTYTFGVSTPTDMAQNNSIIKNAINNS